MNDLEGTNDYALPTEAQWEYAARAGSATAFANGEITETGWSYDPVLNSIGWYDYNSAADHSPLVGGRGTHPVAQKNHNAWGLYDMHGNVSEWEADYWHGSYPSSAVTDPTGPASGIYRVIRGGSWKRKAISCRSAYRDYSTPGYRGNFLGFRLVLLPNH